MTEIHSQILLCVCETVKESKLIQRRLTSVLRHLLEMRHVDVFVRKIAEHFLSPLQRTHRPKNL